MKQPANLWPVDSVIQFQRCNSVSYWPKPSYCLVPWLAYVNRSAGHGYIFRHSSLKVKVWPKLGSCWQNKLSPKYIIGIFLRFDTIIQILALKSILHKFLKILKAKKWRSPKINCIMVETLFKKYYNLQSLDQFSIQFRARITILSHSKLSPLKILSFSRKFPMKTRNLFWSHFNFYRWEMKY